MPGRDGVAGEGPGPLIELFKLQIAVAVDAGIRGSPVPVALDEGGDHTVVKGFGEVEDIKRHAEPEGHAARVLDIVQRAAGLLRFRGILFPGKQAHGAAHAVEALLPQEKGGHAAVHPAAHGDQYFFHHFPLVTAEANSSLREEPDSRSTFVRTLRFFQPLLITLTSIFVKPAFIITIAALFCQVLLFFQKLWYNPPVPQ